MAGAPSLEATPAWLQSCAPKRLSGFESDVAPGKADIVQVTFGQGGQLAPPLLPLMPNVQGFGDLRKQTGTMMIYHRFMRKNGHFHLLKPISWAQYQHCRSLPQTTLCAASHDIGSCI
jgi:hypothetical protein